MVALSKRNAQKEGVGDKAQFIQGDIFETDFSKATVITLFLLPELNVKLRPKILDMKPGTRVVSNSFTMGDWQADHTQNVSEKEGCTAYCTAYLWIVPAKVEGKWKLPDGELTLKQTFQNVTGTLGSGANDQQRQRARRPDHVHRRRRAIHRQSQRRHDHRDSQNRQQQQRLHRDPRRFVDDSSARKTQEFPA